MLGRKKTWLHNHHKKEWIFVNCAFTEGIFWNRSSSSVQEACWSLPSLIVSTQSNGSDQFNLARCGQRVCKTLGSILHQLPWFSNNELKAGRMSAFWVLGWYSSAIHFSPRLYTCKMGGEPRSLLTSGSMPHCRLIPENHHCQILDPNRKQCLSWRKTCHWFQSDVKTKNRKFKITLQCVIVTCACAGGDWITDDCADWITPWTWNWPLGSWTTATGLPPRDIFPQNDDDEWHETSIFIAV